jgi:integrase
MQFHGAFHEEMPHGVAYMTATALPIGAPIAHGVRDSSGLFTSKGRAPKTLSDLFDIFRENPPRSLSMLHTTWSVLAAYLQMPADQITIDSVFENKEGFPRYLERRKYKRNSVRSYANYERILLRKAEELGWNPEESFPEAWRGVLALATEKKCADIARYLARIRKTPAEVPIQDADSWVKIRVQQGTAYPYNRDKKLRFWRLLRDCGVMKQASIPMLRGKSYGIPLDQLPPDLNKELTKLLQWKQAAFSLNRATEARHRKTTTRNLQQFTCQVIGYAINIRGEVGLTSLSQVVTEQIVGGFVEWSINVRQVKGRSLLFHLRLLSAAIRQHPSYKSLDLNWFKPLIDALPIEPKSELKKRKAAKYLEYSVLESIPAMIRAERPAAEKKGIAHVSRRAMEELMMTWLPILPWRQLNVRECRTGGPTPNLFKGRIPPFSEIEKPEWVKQEELNNPAAQFWQFHFTIDETKTGIEVDSLLPRQLIKPLEEYLRDYRPHLLKGADPETLFVNAAGTPMSKNQMIRVVSGLTLKHGGTRMHPHLYRDVVAYAWLKEHPADYLTLSKMFWHANINQVVETYGARFDVSNGVSAMESWRDERVARPT